MTTQTQTEVKERPIIMQPESVRAILEGRKTQTRRVVKPQPPKETGLGITGSTYSNPNDFHALFFRGPTVESTGMGVVKCPYGKPGDHLWCRETFAFVSPDENERPIAECNIEYRADTTDKRPGGWDNDPEDPQALVWRPSIFMPRWASRITLEITDVRVERLHDISEADAIAEGMYTNEAAIKKLNLPADIKLTGLCVDKYRIVWESINGKTYPWSSNPWVWCVSFRRIAQ